MLKSKHFKTEQEMLEWINGEDSPGAILFERFKAIVKDNSNGDWILFYTEF